MTANLPRDISTAELMLLDYRYQYTDAALARDWQQLQTVTEYKTGSQFKPGMKLCQHFCNNFWQIENSRGQSFAGAWQDPVIMDRVREWGLESMSQLWLSWIRRAVFMCAGLPNSSFYRPHFAKQIISLTGLPQGTLFDPCIGWGGRMLGTVASGWNYTGCDPNATTFQNVNLILDFITQHQPAVFEFPVVKLHNIPAEQYRFDQADPVDVVLTSPPYFNLEVYDHAPNQCYNKWNTYAAWRAEWLFPLIERCLHLLKPTGVSAWNVMNFGKNDIVKDVIDFHQQRGWHLMTTVGFDSPLANIRKLKNRVVTYVFERQLSE